MIDASPTAVAALDASREKEAELEARIRKLERAVDHLVEGETKRAWRIMRGMD